MLLSEPSPSPYDLNFTLLGVPVRVSPWFWGVMAIFGYNSYLPTQAIVYWIAAGFISILVHEFGHVMAFRHYGMSSNVVLYGMGGLAVPHSGAVRGAGPQVIISLAGPAAGFALAAALIVGLRLSGVEAGVDFRAGFQNWINLPPFGPRNLYWLIDDLLFMNVYWGVLNLLPVFPLDGGQASRAILTHFNPRDGLRQALMLGVLVGGALAFYGYAELHQTYLAIFFGYMAFNNFQMLQAFGGFGR